MCVLMTSAGCVARAAKIPAKIPQPKFSKGTSTGSSWSATEQREHTQTPFRPGTLMLHDKVKAIE